MDKWQCHQNLQSKFCCNWCSKQLLYYPVASTFLARYCTISTVCSVVCHNRLWTEPKVQLIMVTDNQWTCTKTRCLITKISLSRCLSRYYPILHINMAPNHSPAPYVDALSNFSQNTAPNRYWITRNEPKTFRSQATLACELMNWQSPSVTCHTQWTYSRNGTVLCMALLVHNITVICTCLSQTVLTFPYHSIFEWAGSKWQIDDHGPESGVWCACRGCFEWLTKI